jgi:cell division protein FtsL
MTTVAAPVRRPRPGTPSRGRSAPRRAPAPVRARAATPTASAASRARARAGVAAALTVVFVLVSAVLFHVVLAQGQLRLDRLDARISAERLRYEQLRLQVSTLSSPQRIIEQAESLGLVLPDTPPVYLEVPGAAAPAGRALSPATTLGDWAEVKPHLGDAQP